MIISHRLKFAFFRSPKTGSTTTEIILRMCGVFDPDVDICSEVPRYALPGNVDAHPHLSPTEAIEAGHLTIEQAREYDMYATLRDPIGRAVSVFTHAYSSYKVLNNADVFAKELRKGRDYGLLEKPQVDYFYVGDEQVCEPVAFNNFQDSVRGLLTSLGQIPGANPIDFPIIPNFNLSQGKPANSNRKNWVDNNSDTEIEGMIRSKHAADIVLYEKYYGPL